MQKIGKEHEALQWEHLLPTHPQTSLPDIFMSDTRSLSGKYVALSKIKSLHSFLSRYTKFACMVMTG